jgi:hypothetical protein
MVWIPVIYFCLASMQCGFVQGEPTYTEKGCTEQLIIAAQYAQQKGDVVLFDGTCASANAI